MNVRCSIVLFVVALGCGTSTPSRQSSSSRGIKLQTDGPRGGSLLDPGGKEVEYRIFRVHVRNDSTVPVDLTLGFPGGPVPLSPESNAYLDVFLFPGEITPEAARDEINFGIEAAEGHIRERARGPTTRRATVPPGDEQLAYVGVTFSQPGQGGLARAEMVLEGQRPDPAFFPVGSSPAVADAGAGRGLVFGIAIDPPRHHALIPCGRIVFAD